jgi:hypothetical protein
MIDSFDELMARVNNPALQREHQKRQQQDAGLNQKIERHPSFSEQSLASITSLTKGLDMRSLSDDDAAFVIKAIEQNSNDYVTMTRLQKLYNAHNPPPPDTADEAFRRRASDTMGI